MKISKTKFLNLIRCPSYAPFLELYQKKSQAIVGFAETLDDIVGLEAQIKKQELLDYMYEENEDGEEIDLVAKEKDQQLEVMQEYYTKIEEITATVIQKTFSGSVIYDLNTFKQKYACCEFDGYQFFCFLDGFQEDAETVRIIETKATTSRKFLDLKYKDKQKNEFSFFVTTTNGILIPRADVEKIGSQGYLKQEQKLFDRFSDIGKYVYDLAYQRMVYEQTDKTGKKLKCYLSVLNSEYVYDGAKDDHNNPIYGDDIIHLIDLTSITRKLIDSVLLRDLKAVSRYLENLDARPEIVKIGKHCQHKKSRECQFYDICCTKIKEIPAINSVFTYYKKRSFTDDQGNKRTTFDLANMGIKKALDVPVSWLESENHLIQHEVIEKNSFGIDYVYYDKIKIIAALNEIKFPVYHLDFESFQSPLPRFINERPYVQSLFQFSIHVQKAPFLCDKDLDNYSFLASDHSDIREELIKKMLEVIKDDGGTVLVYNQSFEKTRIKELASMFPQYKVELLKINERIFDLLFVLVGNKNLYNGLGFIDDKSTFNYYHNDLNGSFSIKKVLPIFSPLTYKGMMVANGTEAQVSYALLPHLDSKRKTILYNALIEYCKQDTFAMVEIFNVLYKKFLRD